jgi:hypothetical protein
MQARFSVAIFESSTLVLRAERACLQAGFKVKLIPVPRSVASDCGVCLRVETPAKDAVVRHCATLQLAPLSVHDI